MHQPTYLVTGGAGDIGAWVVRALVEDGANVHVLARPSDRLEALRHLPITIHEGDATDETTVQAVVKEAAGDGLEGVVHAVGSIALRPPHALKAAAFREVIDTTLDPAFLLSPSREGDASSRPWSNGIHLERRRSPRARQS